jgi:hypothetical protein
MITISQHAHLIDFTTLRDCERRLIICLELITIAAVDACNSRTLRSTRSPDAVTVTMQMVNPVQLTDVTCESHGYQRRGSGM